MRKDILILFSILLMSQGLSAFPAPEPESEPPYFIQKLLYNSRAWITNVILAPALRAVRYVYDSALLYTRSNRSIYKICNANITVGQNVENFYNSCSKAVENITEEYNIFTTESESMNSATTVSCSSAMLSANDNLLMVMYGAFSFMHSISGFGPPPPMNNTGPFDNPEPYPTPQSPMPSPPADRAALPEPPTLCVQSRYAKVVLTRMLSDLLTLVRVVDEFKETTGSTVESVSETEVQRIRELFNSVITILTNYENQSTVVRLISVLTVSEMTQINNAVTKMSETVESVKNSIKKGVKEVKTSRKTNAYQKSVEEVRNNKRSSEEFANKVNEIRKKNEKNGRRYVSRAFNTARESSNKAYTTVTDARNSLVKQSKVLFKTVRDKSYWIYEYIVKPKMNTVQVELDTIPICLATIFSNLSINITTINNNTEISNNNTYHNASSVVSQAVTILTDFIAKECTCKINCAQAANDDLQEIQCKFHRDSKTCLEQASVFNQKAVTNCTETTISISESVNSMASKSVKCVRDSGAPNTYYINFLGFIVRQNIVACFDPIEKQAGNFCNEARNLCSGTHQAVVSVSNETTTSYKNCSEEKVKEALKAINVISETYSACSKTQPSPPPTTPGPFTTAGSTTESSTTGSSTTGSSTTGSSTTGSSTTGSSTTGSSTTGSSTTGSSTTGSSTTGSSSTYRTSTCGCQKMTTSFSSSTVPTPTTRAP